MIFKHFIDICETSQHFCSYFGSQLLANRSIMNDLCNVWVYNFEFYFTFLLRLWDNWWMLTARKSIMNVSLQICWVGLDKKRWNCSNGISPTHWRVYNVNCLHSRNIALSRSRQSKLHIYCNVIDFLQKKIPWLKDHVWRIFVWFNVL